MYVFHVAVEQCHSPIVFKDMLSISIVCLSLNSWSKEVGSTISVAISGSLKISCLMYLSSNLSHQFQSIPIGIFTLSPTIL